MAKNDMKMAQIGNSESQEVMRKIRKCVVNSIITAGSRPRPHKLGFGKESSAGTKE
jgi:hypothetical protein